MFANRERSLNSTRKLKFDPLLWIPLDADTTADLDLEVIFTGLPGGEGNVII